MFIDEASIEVRGGHGGNGCVSFRREKYVPYGGPDGGNGGHGGNVIATVDKGLKTLMDFSYRRHFFAGKGSHGEGSNKNGRRGKDVVICLPPGTMINDEHGNLIADLTEEGQEVTVARGGWGGKGNTKFATSTNRAPTNAEPGQPGEERLIRLELKLLADVALIGLPNAGKSTLINKISAAKAKVADYPFTTTVPNLGVVVLAEGKAFVVADIPGLVEGAHDGKGMGIKFLRHIERASFLVHLIDLSSGDVEQVLKDYKTLKNELEAYSQKLASLPGLAIGNKVDLVTDKGFLKAVAQSFRKLKEEYFAVSAITGEGVDKVVFKIADRLDKIRPGSD